MLELLLAGRRRTRRLLLSPNAEPAPILDHIVEVAQESKVRIRVASRSEFESAARTAAPQGVIAFADPLDVVELTELLHPRAFLLVLDGITDPGNVGAILRSAEGAGVTGVVLPSHRAALITPAAAKAATGAVEHLRFAVVGGLPTALRVMKEHQVWTVGLDAAGERTLYDLDLSGESVALVLGAEGAGLSRLVSERCDLVVSIPLRGVLGSLNVSAAAAIGCFEVARHRST